MTEFEEDFEGENPLANFDYVKQQNGAVMIEKGTAAKGEYYLRCDSYAVAAQRKNRVEKDFTAKEEVFCRIYYMQKRAFPTSDTGRISPIVIQKNTAATLFHLCMRILKNGALKVQYRHASADPVQDLGVSLELDRWYCIEVQAKRGTTDGTIRVWLDGELLWEKLDVNNTDADVISNICAGDVLTDSNAHVPEHEAHVDLFTYGDEYIGVYTPPPPSTPPTVAETMSGMINSMMSIMMLMMVMQMMTGMVKGIKKET